MEIVAVLLRQIAIMALLVAVGIFLSRKGYLTEQGAKDLGAILIRLIIPCVIIRSCLVDFSVERLKALGLSAALALLASVLAMGIAYLVYGQRRRLENFAAAFCNAGFIGIPLVQTVVGQEGVFYIAASVAFLNLFQWTYGVFIMTGRKDAASPKTVLKNPVLIAMLIGVALFLLPVSVPAVLTRTLGYIADLNTPVAMLLTGTYMARLPFRKLLDKRAYGCVALRLVAAPAVILLAFWLLPLGDAALTLSVFIAAATPVGANICVFAQQHGCDYEFSVVTVCLSTLLSVLTMPVMIGLAQMLL